MPLYPPPSSGSLAIGAAIAAGTAGRMLYEGAGPVLADAGAGSVSLILGILSAAAWGASPTNQDLTWGAGRFLSDNRFAGELTLSHAAMTTTANYTVRVNASGAPVFNAAAGQALKLGIGGAIKWQVGTGFDMSPATDNAFDLGLIATRVRRGYLAEYLELSEMTAPGTPGAAKSRFYLKDNAGKQNLVMKWDDGVETLIAAQP